MSKYITGFQNLDKTSLTVAGGKGANLGELARIVGILVPDGFCITTEAFKRIIAGNAGVEAMLDQLALVPATDRPAIASISAGLRHEIEAIPVPADIREAIGRYLTTYGPTGAYAVRSSATAEDLPTASFAGQQDTYLNIIGEEAILSHIRKCWASLFTERAISYRNQHGFDHRTVYLAVVIQKMVFPLASGMLFTADPVTSNRKVVSIDAGFGLGEALVSGRTNADTYKVRDGVITEKTVPAKTLVMEATIAGGTQERDLPPDQQNRQVLTDPQIHELARIGRRIEAHFGSPQDIEWCLAGEQFYIVQSRPITTLYPLPAVSDHQPHVYISVGHQQMMTDPIRPLGMSLWQLTAGRPMYQAGGRLFVDVAPELATPAGRQLMLNVLGNNDPLIKDALTTILEREDFIRLVPDEVPGGPAGGPALADYQTLKDFDPSVVGELIRQSQASIEALREEIREKTGPALIDFILDHIRQIRGALKDPRSFAVIMTAMNASVWLNEHIAEWLGEKGVADTLTQSVPHNITSEMGLALLDVADIIRPNPAVIDLLQQAVDDSFLNQLDNVQGGHKARKAILAFLDQYGMRCSGEIDITRPRWREKPTMLLPLLLSNVKNSVPGAARQKFEEGLREATRKRDSILDRLRQLPDGDEKAAAADRMIQLVRNLIGYREYPKYDLVSRYFICKQALLAEADRLVQAGILTDTEAVFYLTFDELGDLTRTLQADNQLIQQRKADYIQYEKLTPPRVYTSEGEIIRGSYKRENLPAGAIAGLPVSAGVVEGRARVLREMGEAEPGPDDILVTSFTDPGWTPLFVSIKGLVTEVGGLMTHGAVIAREYGLPAVVGIEKATTLIKDGQRIRVNGTEGYVEILDFG
ncbi:rifamycin-inactivating phosphotransferase [Arsenicibacter rosenii]|uniref:Prodigiosin synthesizing transferase PigC n=1 Tax=Arsenicibacter rosenii TaxID=1750698 RepID=A0A1S2VLC3_9BACT|nr:rifamycin-inactivating phosphotransferase [Arsenicibacter rosenii]OIN59577.1 phosphoenolpyruvate synthase [Arsenicibacter rosenii]